MPFKIRCPLKMGGETGAQREPSENFSEGSRWAPNAQPEPHFRREDGVGIKMGVKMGDKKLFNNPVSMQKSNLKYHVSNLYNHVFPTCAIA